MSKTLLRRTGWFCLIVFVVGVVFLSLINGGPDEPLTTALLSDGRVLQIEGVSYGTNHEIGERSPLLDRFARWLPGGLARRFAPKSPFNTLDSGDAALVVWVNALSGPAGTNVDC